MCSHTYGGDAPGGFDAQVSVVCPQGESREWLEESGEVPRRPSGGLRRGPCPGQCLVSGSGSGEGNSDLSIRDSSQATHMRSLNVALGRDAHNWFREAWGAGGGGSALTHQGAVG